MLRRGSVRWWGACALVAALTAAVCSPLVETAFFGLDDHRYLRELRDIREGEPGALWRALVVENRWDQHWWIEEGTFVRFFRPLVIAAYAVDAWLWGPQPLGFVATNVALHLVATLLFLALCVRLLGRGPGALIAGVSFGTALAHFENLYYIPGRTEALAAIAFLAALWTHLRTRERPSLKSRLLVAFLCFLAFLGKESTALLPVFLVLLDWFVPPAAARPGVRAALRANAVLIAACAAFAALYLVLRSLAIGPEPGSSPYPYLHLPDREGFAGRTLAVWLQYSLSLSVGTFIQTFLEVPAQLYGRVSWIELAVGSLWVPALCALGATDGRGRFFAAVLLLSLLPQLPLYSSARHVYVASIGYCGLLGWLGQRLLERRHWLPRLAVGLGVVLFVGIPAIRLALLLHEHPRALAAAGEDGRLRSPGSVIAKSVTAGGVVPRPDRPLYLLDFPGGWYEMQFLADALEVELDAEMPLIHVLAPLLSNPAHRGRGVRVRRVDDSAIEIDRGGMPLIDPGGGGFDKRHLEPGDVVHRNGYEFEVLDTKRGRPTRARIRFDRSLADIDLGQFTYRDGWVLCRVSL